MVASMVADIRTHFRRLPKVILNKLRAACFPEDEIRRFCQQFHIKDDYEDDGTNNADVNVTTGIDDGIEDDCDSDKNGVFIPNHIKECWTWIQKLKPSNRPVFFPRPGFGDSFMLFSEHAFIDILWGGRKGNKDHPTRQIMDTFLPKAEALELANSQYGELFRRLFIGDPATIRERKDCNQTMYGRKATTMQQLHNNGELENEKVKEYVARRSQYLKQKKENDGGGSSSSSTLVEPELPTATGTKHCVLSNILRTNGLEIHAMGFDVKRKRIWGTERVPIQDITRAMPNNNAVAKVLGDDPLNVVCVGVDPGEIVSASFCAVDPKRPQQPSNLLVRRAAIYSPALKHRTWMEKAKRERLPEQARTPEMTTYRRPSINELEQALSRDNSINRFVYVYDALSSFYASQGYKRRRWDLKKATRAEYELALTGAMRTVDPAAGSHEKPSRPCLFIYGSAKFNTRLDSP
ncbi:hypothetical protein BGZ65_001686 [Modicella reniformis]|uniref:Uncharacterized protein n=1 Tax=Modicella reniformis TaxID=1440133 RepID=A0A9P6ILP5_9FUNG|nr:hypothetical protein BGZ65_001686 [Modicella reniformis]